MTITYKKIDDYYIFSHKPKNRVYLGDIDIGDYINDEENQLIRSTSAHYYEIATGKKVDRLEIPQMELIRYEIDI